MAAREKTRLQRTVHLAESDRGAATAEMAIAMIAISLLLALILGAGSLMAVRVQLVDVSRTVAREVIRGEDDAAARAAGARIAHSPVQITIVRRGEYVEVISSKTLGIGGLLPPTLEIEGKANARIEPDLIESGSRDG